MDIEILLALQNFRNSINPVFEDIGVFLSEFSVSVWPIMIWAFVYWNVNKQLGNYAMMNLGISEMGNGIAKLTVCAYRPWKRDARIIPAGDSLTTATGYSFPSGHSTRATYLYGSAFKTFWKKKGTKIISIILCILIGLTMFARIFLGVHTPQDIVFGLGMTIIVLIIDKKIIKWLDKNKDNDIKFALGSVILMIVTVLYINLKSYPLDYVNGELLVDPVKMMPDTYQACGFMLGYTIGLIVERRLIKHTPKLDAKNIIVSIIALVPMYFLYVSLPDVLKNTYMSKSMYKFTVALIVMLYIMVVVPYILKLINKEDK